MESEGIVVESSRTMLFEFGNGDKTFLSSMSTRVSTCRYIYAARMIKSAATPPIKLNMILSHLFILKYSSELFYNFRIAPLFNRWIRKKKLSNLQFCSPKHRP